MTLLAFKNASEVLSERQATSRLTTGNADLDSLLGGGIEPGQFYLFYGNENSGVDRLMHYILVNSLLPKQMLGFGGRCVYSNCGNYREETPMVDTELLGNLAKAARLDPVKALDDIYTICSFSEEEEEHVFTEIQKLLEKDRDIKLIVVQNIAKFFSGNSGMRRKGACDRIARLQSVVSGIQRVCAENDLAFVASCRPIENNPCYAIPRPEGGKYLSHKATVIVYLEKKTRSVITAYLIKHPNRAPRKIDLKYESGGMQMGRLTEPFRTKLQKEMDNLKISFREALIDAARRDAFDSLLKAWCSEEGAMSYARVPTALDVMLLTAAIDNRKCVEELSDQIGVIGSKLTKIEAELEKLLG